MLGLVWRLSDDRCVGLDFFGVEEEEVVVVWSFVTRKIVVEKFGIDASPLSSLLA